MTFQSSVLSRDLERVRGSLLKWAVHIAHSETDQQALVDRTIEAAKDNPFELPENEPVERALMSLMLRIAQTEMAGLPAHQIKPVENSLR